MKSRKDIALALIKKEMCQTVICTSLFNLCFSYYYSHPDYWGPVLGLMQISLVGT